MACRNRPPLYRLAIAAATEAGILPRSALDGPEARDTPEIVDPVHPPDSLAQPQITLHRARSPTDLPPAHPPPPTRDNPPRPPTRPPTPTTHPEPVGTQ